MSDDPDSERGTTTRRTVLGALGAGVGLVSLGAAVSSGQSSDYWTVVALPDTQVYADNGTTYASDQTRWIVENRDAENIVFVSHEGDVVEHGGVDEEWQYMDDAMSALDGTVPYATVPGNHDWVDELDRSSSIAKYKQYFGPSRYEDRDWFGGAGPTNGEENRDDLNTYQQFSAGGYDFLHLGLEWEPPGSVDDSSTPLGWAQQVLDQYPDRPTILTTHSYYRDDPEGRPKAVQESNGDGNAGQTVWEDLVSPNAQVFMVLCGHWFRDDGEAHQVSTNDADEQVYEILANYQGRSKGGHGLLRRIEFRPGEGDDVPDRIQVRTSSPSTGEVKEDSDSQFSFDLDFDSRFGSASSETQRVTFQQGVDGYDGTVDIDLREADPETAYGDAETATVDSDDPQGSGNSAQALVRFDGLVGAADGQLPRGATVESATLTLDTTDEGDGAELNRMLTGWTDDETWASIGDGVQADDTEASSEAVSRIGPVSTGTTTVTVTQSVQAWADGARNHGWVFRPLGDDGWDFRTAESGTPPQLTVQYAPPETRAGDADSDGDVDSDDVALVQRSIANEGVDIDGEAADVDGDGDVDIGDAVTIRNISEESS